MTQPTALDRAHTAMAASPDHDGARLQFFERLADAELFLLLEAEAAGETITPQVFDPGTGPMVLVFDRAERLTQFVGAPAPFAALSGRALVVMLADEAMGLGLNLDVAPSSFLLDAEGVSWLAQTVRTTPDAIETRLSAVTAPKGLPDTLLTALDTKLATATGLAQIAYLVGTTGQEGRQGHMLGFVGALPGAESALTQAVSEALVFSGLEAGTLDVGFFDGTDPVVQQLAQVGLRFDMPQLAPATAPIAPGMDPAKPPKLR